MTWKFAQLCSDLKLDFVENELRFHCQLFSIIFWTDCIREKSRSKSQARQTTNLSKPSKPSEPEKTKTKPEAAAADVDTDDSSSSYESSSGEDSDNNDEKGDKQVANAVASEVSDTSVAGGDGPGSSIDGASFSDISNDDLRGQTNEQVLRREHMWKWKMSN